jgi:hypothetical protein
MKLKKSVVFLTALASMGGFAAFGGGGVYASPLDDALASLTPEQRAAYARHVANITPVKLDATNKIFVEVFNQGKLAKVTPKLIDDMSDRLDERTDEEIQANIESIPNFVQQYIQAVESGGTVITDDLQATRLLYRLLNPNSKDKNHLITDSLPEVEKARKLGWKLEGIVGTYNVRGQGAPIYRLRNSNNVDEHHYTHDWNEVKALIKVGWVVEGGEETVEGETRNVAFYVPNVLIGRDKVMQQGPIFGALYRMYNKTNGGEHFYTMNWNEVQQATTKLGWVYEGILCIYN